MERDNPGMLRIAKQFSEQRSADKPYWIDESKTCVLTMRVALDSRGLRELVWQPQPDLRKRPSLHFVLAPLTHLERFESLHWDLVYTWTVTDLSNPAKSEH